MATAFKKIRNSIVSKLAIPFGPVLRIVKRPINKTDVDQADEMGQLSAAIDRMGQKIGEKQAEHGANLLDTQRDMGLRGGLAQTGGKPAGGISESFIKSRL